MFETYILEPLIKNISKFGDRNAFCIDEKHYTYHEFAKNVSKIRFELKQSKISGKIIGLVVNDDIETYASIFAIWLEGFAYVPLHPLQPIDRSLEIIAQADISLVLNSNDRIIIPNIKSINTSKVYFTDFLIDILPVDENELAYILFTSGSTGKPKGVQITRKNIGAFMKSFWETGIVINEYDKCLQCFDLTFDVSVQSFLVPLTTGACTYTIPHDQIKYSYVFGLLEDHQLAF